jgi:hypothetical protein
MLKMFKKTKYILTWSFPFIVKRPVPTLSIVERLAKVKSTFIEAYKEADSVDNAISTEINSSLDLIKRTQDNITTLEGLQKSNDRFMSQLAKFI